MARVSDDFYPRDPASFKPHIGACAYIGFFMSALVQPDWDMFQRWVACAYAQQWLSQRDLSLFSRERIASMSSCSGTGVCSLPTFWIRRLTASSVAVLSSLHLALPRM